MLALPRFSAYNSHSIGPRSPENAFELCNFRLAATALEAILRDSFGPSWTLVEARYARGNESSDFQAHIK